MGFLDDTAVYDELEAKSDEEILALSVKRPQVFRVIIERYEDALLRKAKSILHSREEAEDIVQEAFTKMYIHAPRFKVQEGASFRSWAYRIVVNTAFTRYQKLKREKGSRVALDPEIYEMLKDTSSRGFEKQEVAEYVFSILSRIPEHLHRALYLHMIEGRPQEEVAEIEGVSVGAVKTRVHRAKKAFREIAAMLAT